MPVRRPAAGALVAFLLLSLGLSPSALASSPPVAGPARSGAAADFDSRPDTMRAEPTSAQLAAARALGAVVRFDQRTGLVRSIMPARGPLTSAAAAPAGDVALGYLAAHADLFGISPADLTTFRVRDALTIEGSGATVVTVHQYVADTQVFGSVLTFGLDARNRLGFVGGTYEPAAAVAAAPALSASDAVLAAARSVGASPQGPLERIGREAGTTTFANVFARGIAGAMEVEATRVIFPMPGALDRAAWHSIIEVDHQGWYQLVVDAATGELLYRQNLYAEHSEGTVFTGEHPAESGPRQTIALTGIDGDWVVAPEDRTIGNNVDAYEDRDEDDAPDAGGYPIAADQHFNFAWADAYQTSGGTDVDTDEDATVTQMFYYANVVHDFLYGLGFTEPWRNFQTDNFGRGGSGGDPVNAEARDGWGTGTEELCLDDDNNPILCRNNANFGTPPDGDRPRMQMYMWTPGNPFVDGAMDGDVIAHEYGHGLSKRLVGGGTFGSGKQAGSLGEGWSDTVSMMLWDDPVIGEYVTGNTATGIRGVSYDTSTLDYADFTDASGVHSNGRIWATTMWNVLDSLRSEQGTGPGLSRFRQLMVDGLKLTVTSPTMVDARDGMLGADLLTNGGNDWCSLWVQFAERQLGTGAAGTATTADPDDTIPDECLPTADIGGPYMTVEGTSIGLDGTASGPGSHHSTGTLTYAWDLDDDGQFDDSTSQTPTFTKVGQDGSFDIGLRVTNTAGATDTATGSVTVANVAPDLSIGNDGPEDEGSAVEVSGLATDPGWLDALSATIDWGSGPEALPGTLENTPPDATLSFAAAHVFYDNGIYPVEVCVSDDDTTTCQMTDVTIDNVSPDVSGDPGQVTEIDEGGSVTAKSLFSDPGSLDTYTGTVDWGDAALGSDPATIDVTTDGPPGPDAGTAAATQQYGDNGGFTVSTTVTDDDLGTETTDFLLTVKNVDPTAEIDLTGAILINGVPTILGSSGDPVPFTGRSDDPGSDDLTFGWDWDDGSTDGSTSLVNPPGLDFLPSPTNQARVGVEHALDHTFADACAYEPTLDVTDDDAGASPTSEVAVIIVGHADEAEKDGFWHHQYKERAAGKEPKEKDLTEDELLCYLEIASFGSTIFDEVRGPLATLEDGHAIFHKDESLMSEEEKLDKELLSAWLNFANGAFGFGELVVDTDHDHVPDLAFSDAVASAEVVRANPASTKDELHDSRKLLEKVNKFKG